MLVFYRQVTLLLRQVIIMQHMQDALDPRFARYLLESMADGVFTLNRAGIITSWNASMEKISGYSAQEALGRTCTMLSFNLCLKKSCPSGIKECGIYERGAVDAKECALRHKDGHDVPVLKSARLVKNGHNSVIGVVETVTDLTELKKARQQIEEISRKLGDVHRLDNIIGRSRAMQDVFSAIRSAAASEATVLIQGESGTGKELVAGAIHYNSDRAGKPLVTVNCSALTESLLESELFGHAKGAFTGAIRDRKGRFEEAEGGGCLSGRDRGNQSLYWQVILSPCRIPKQTNTSRVFPRPPCVSSWITPGLEMSGNWKMPSNMPLCYVMKKRSIFSICRLNCERRAISRNRPAGSVSPKRSPGTANGSPKGVLKDFYRNVIGTRQRLQGVWV